MQRNTAHRLRGSRGRLIGLAFGLVLCACAAAWQSAAKGQQRAGIALHLGPVEEDLAGHEPTARRGSRVADRDVGPGETLDGTATESSGGSRETSRPTRWHGTLKHNPDTDPESPPYIVVDKRGLKRRYIRTAADENLEAFVDRPVTVLDDTGLLLDLDQIALRRDAASSPQPTPAPRVATAAARSPVRDDRVETAAYDEPPPRFEPKGDPTVSAQDVTSASLDEPKTSDAQDQPTARVAERLEELPLMTSSGQPILPGQNLAMSSVLPGGGICPTCGKQHGASGCACGARGRVFGRAEALYWWTDGFYVPPLVTTSPNGTAQADAGVLGEPGTSIVFGNAEVVDGPFTGGRASAGWWLRGVDKLGIEGDYLALEQESFQFSRFANNGSPILGRPFFNALLGEEDAALVAFPNLIEGAVTVDGASDLEMAGLRLRIAACCNDIPPLGNTTSRVDFLAGYRYSQLDEQLRIFEDSTSLDAMNPGDFLIRDSFATDNEFHGGEAGVVWEWDRPRLHLELLGRIAIGTNQQNVFINGNTVVSDGMFSLEQTGGILAQRTNIGHYERNRLSVIPELSATLSFKVTQRLRLTAGYTFLYWSNVVRPGEQIDLDLNPNLFPPEVVPFDGPLRPQFAWRETDFWAHGVSAGVDYRF